MSAVEFLLAMFGKMWMVTSPPHPLIHLWKICETLDKGKGSWHILTNTNSLSGLSHSVSKPVSSGTVKFVEYRVKNSSSAVKYPVDLKHSSQCLLSNSRIGTESHHSMQEHSVCFVCHSEYLTGQW